MAGGAAGRDRGAPGVLGRDAPDLAPDLPGPRPTRPVPLTGDPPKLSASGHRQRTARPARPYDETSDTERRRLVDQLRQVLAGRTAIARVLLVAVTLVV